MAPIWKSGQSMGVTGSPTTYVTATEETQVVRVHSHTFLCWAILPTHTHIFKIVGRGREWMKRLVWPEMNSNEFQTHIFTCLLEASQIAPGRNKLGHWAIKFPWPLSQPRRQHTDANYGCQDQPNRLKSSSTQMWPMSDQWIGRRQCSVGSWLWQSPRYQKHWDQLNPARYF